MYNYHIFIIHNIGVISCSYAFFILTSKKSLFPTQMTSLVVLHAKQNILLVFSLCVFKHYNVLQALGS